MKHKGKKRIAIKGTLKVHISGDLNIEEGFLNLPWEHQGKIHQAMPNLTLERKRNLIGQMGQGQKDV